MDLEGEDKIVSVALVEAAVADELPPATTHRRPPADEPPRDYQEKPQ